MLRVWLPLDGDLRNLGCSDVTVTNNGATVDNNGKIGKCYSFTSGKYLQSAIPTNLKTKAISYTCWIYITSWNNSWDAFMSIANGTGWNTSRATLCRNNTASTLTWNIADGSTSVRVNSITAINLNTWYHVACTYDGTNLKIYINGNLDNSISSTLSIIYAGTFNIGGWSGNNYPINGKLNDVRIYDHCLSAAEVHEIAMGLVLHYKLDGNGWGNPNLFTEPYWSYSNTKWTYAVYSPSGSSTIKPILQSNKDILFTGAGTNSSDQCYLHNINNKINLNGGKTYTISATITASGAGYWRFYWYDYDDSPRLSINSKEYSFVDGETKTISYTRTLTEGTTKCYWELNMIRSATTSTMILHANSLKLEEGSIATPWCPNAADALYSILGLGEATVSDSSGYGHKGEIISELHISNDTARYNNSTLFDGVDDCIIVPYNEVCPENIFTINLWFKKDALGSKNYETLFGGPGGFEMDTRESSATSLSLYMATTRGRNRATGITMNEWHMITMTRDGTTEKYYVDGEFKSEIEAKYMPNGVYRIGAWASNTGQNYYGLISDFRIYCTPLLDNDIKMLYNVGMKVDNLGEVHAFEFNEKDNNLLAGNMITSAFDNRTNPYTKYNSNGEIYFNTNSTSAGSNYIPINPTNHTYYYDFDISVNAGNRFYIGFERFDANKTSRTNNATVYVYGTKTTEDANHKHIFGTVNLSTDGVNPCAFIALRILNGWSGTTSGVIGTATIHNMSLREISTIQNPKSYKNGILSTGEFKENQKAAFYKNGFIESTEFIEI